MEGLKIVTTIKIITFAGSSRNVYWWPAKQLAPGLSPTFREEYGFKNQIEIYFSFFVQDFRSTIKSQVNLGITSHKEITCSCDMFPSDSTLQPITSPPLWVEKYLAADVPPDWGPNHVSMARDAERQQEQMEHHLLIIIIMMAVMILMMMMNIILGNLENQMTCPQYSSLLH